MRIKNIFDRSILKRALALTLCTLLVCTFFFGCDQGKVIDGNLIIELDGNPTTGYTWVYEMSQEGIIEEVSSTYNELSGSDALVGAGGTFRFEFSAVAPGEVALQFSYQRSFQENSVIKTKSYAVTVDNDMTITLYETDLDDETDLDNDDDSDNDSGIVAGSTFIDTVVFGETTDDVVFTWTLCNAGFYIGVDTEYLQWYYSNGVDNFVPIYTTDETVFVGTSMKARRYTDTDKSAEEYADMLAADNELLTEFSEFTAEIDNLPAIGVYCSNPDIGVSATYYFVEVDSDVVEIAIFYEGSIADDIGARLDTMAKSITFTNNVGIMESSAH